MDIVELKRINSKMLKESPSSEQFIPIKSGAHRPNPAYCDIDIISSYKQEKRTKHKRDRKQKDNADISDLSKRIEDLTVRNDKIKQLLVGKVGDDRHVNEASQSEKPRTPRSLPIEKEKRHRESRSRRSRHKEEKCSEKTLPSLAKIEKSSGSPKPRLDSSVKEQPKSKHRSRKAESQENHLIAAADSCADVDSNVITLIVTDPRESMRSRRSSKDDSRSQSRRERQPRKEPPIVKELAKVPESKSQLICVHDYKSKLDVRQEDNKVLTVYENNHLIDETDSLISRDTLKKSWTRTHSRDRSIARLKDNEKYEQKHKAIKEDDLYRDDENFPKVRLYRRRSRSRKLDNSEIEEELLRSFRAKSPISSISPRKELSFSNLNLTPEASHYVTTTPRVTGTQTSVSRIEAGGFGTRSIGVNEAELEPQRLRANVLKASPVLSQTTIALRDIMQVRELELKQQQQQLGGKNKISLFKSKMMDQASPQDFMAKNTTKGSIAKNNKFHKTKNVVPADRIVEISSKTVNDEQITFTVEGIEPPRRLHCDRDIVKSMRVENVFTLQVFPGITITHNDVKSLSHGSTHRSINETLSICKAPAIEYASKADNFSNDIDPSSFYLANTRSEFKPKSKESSEISYKFRKKSWSSKELPRKKTSKVVKLEKQPENSDEVINRAKKEKKKHKKVIAVQTVTKDASIQTIHSEHLVDTGVMTKTNSKRVSTDAQTMATLDVAVSTPVCRPDHSKLIQVCTTVESADQTPLSLMAKKNKRRVYPIRRRSHSDSNIDNSEVFVRKIDYGTCTGNTSKVASPKKLVSKLVGKSSSHINITSSSETPKISKPAPEVKKTKVSALPKWQGRSRKLSHSCCPKERPKSPLSPNTSMSTGSIQKLPHAEERKSRSKSLSQHRESLVQKINLNKETIMHHREEIAALEKCLHAILNRLDLDDVLGRNSNSGDSLDGMQFLRELIAPKVSHKYQYLYKEQIPKPIPEKPKIPMSKFHRGKAYGEKIKQRARKSRELASKLSIRSKKSAKLNITKPKTSKLTNKFKKSKYPSVSVSPVRVRSVYKNTRGFISSASSLSSKISDFMERSSSTYPRSIPSVNIACCNVNKPHNRLKASSSSDYKYRGKSIVKKKHKIKGNKQQFSRKKSESIYDMLMQYVNLSSTSKIDTPEGKALKEGLSKIVVLSVSSVKLKKKYYNNPGPPSPIIENTTDSLSSVSKRKVLPKPKEKDSKPREPFFITPTEVTAPVANPDVTSADSLEFDTQVTHNTPQPDLCPLTAIFNFEPKSCSYLVYNTEVISPKKPKIVEQFQPQPGTSHSFPGTSNSFPVSTPPSPSVYNDTASTSAGHKMPIIMEEKQAFANLTSRANPMSIIFDESDRRLPDSIKPIADLSPILSRRPVYPSYQECLKQLEMMNAQMPALKVPRQQKLTTFNCNSKECSQLIFNYTSKKDKNPLVCEKHESSAYRTLTTIMDKKSVSAFSDTYSETGLKNPNESGYESSKMSSFKNFFKKRALFDVFKSKGVNKKKSDDSSMRTLGQKESPSYVSNVTTTSSEKIDAEDGSPMSASKTVLWFNFRKKKRDPVFPCDAWCTTKKNQAEQTETPTVCKATCHKPTKCIGTGTLKSLVAGECPCNIPFEQQQEQCQKYASKVIMEAAKRQEGYKRQYDDFKEIPLEVLIGKRDCACKALHQSCIKSYANKKAGIIAKQESEVPPVQPTVVPPVVEQPEPSEIKPLSIQTEEKPPFLPPSPQLEEEEEEEDEEVQQDNDEAIAKSLEDVSRDKRCLTDREIFDKLLTNFERKEDIAARLSQDAVFFSEQIELVNAGVVPDKQVPPDRPGPSEQKMRGPRFSDRPRPLVQVTNANTIVKPDDIGTCFARGFRPDNLMLSGDACFHINKQDKIKMSPYMLKDTESIIDFSERETPLDFLLALGFMVDEASNALKDDDIRSRLLAAITEARVWINKITTTQGTLLYLVAYKARPETMRYFLQLVEAIINKRINNAIRLDGFLRILEDVEAGRLQMITILGEDKFEDEENEEKMVKKQLKNLFITVYTVAEKETAATGRTITPKQISLLRILVAKYRAGLHPHLELIARYIGQGLLENEVQLEAAMIFLSRLDTSEVKLKEFENYCGITCQLRDT